MKKTIIFIFSILMMTSVFGKTEAIKDYEIRSYDPVAMGMKDLYFEIHIDGLTEAFKKNNSMIELKGEIYYKVFWLYPGKVEVDIEGLPKGFHVQRTGLLSLVNDKLTEIIPTKLSKTLRSYELSQSKKGKYTIVKAKDRTRLSAVTEMELVFDSESRLKSVSARSPMGSQRVNHIYKAMPWSKNKWVKNKSIANSVTGIQTTKVEKNYYYKSVKGIGLIEKIEVNTTQTLNQNTKDGKEQKRSSSDKVYVKGHRVNEGVAQSYFRNNTADGN
ncbi:MAG: hypothetical protein GY909_12145 [Oligoflexia bacterium]|nr:hypothetical protein [Oligoflexia bacterium]